MSQTVVLVFLGTNIHRADLSAWAQAHLLKLEVPRTPTEAYPRHDEALVDRIEQLLDQAQVLTGAGDDSAAERQLGDVDSLLRAHPELPQSAWLMAEMLSISAQLRERTDSEAARILRDRARVLEGLRSEEFRGTNAVTTTTTSSRTPPPSEREKAPGALATGPAPTTVTLTDLESNDYLYVDGVETSSKRVTITVGEHHVRVVRRSRVVWAGWVQARAETPEIVVPAPRSIACSTDELAGTAIRHRVVEPPSNVRCPRWAVARARVGGGIEVALCHESECGALLPWHHGDGIDYAGPPQLRPAAGNLPTWAGLVIAGIGAAAITGIVLWRSGAFESTPPAQPVWRFYGP